MNRHTDDDTRCYRCGRRSPAVLRYGALCPACGRSDTYAAELAAASQLLGRPVPDPTWAYGPDIWSWESELADVPCDLLESLYTL